MLTAGTLLNVHHNADSVATTAITMTSRLPVTPAVIGAFTCAVPSTTLSTEVGRTAVSRTEAIAGELKSLSGPHGEYLVTRIVNGKPVLPLDQLVGRTATGGGVVDGRGGVVPRGPGVAAQSAAACGSGKDGDAVTPPRRDVVVLLAAGPASATAEPTWSGTVTHPGATSYVYYTALPRFCAAVTTTSGPRGSLAVPPNCLSASPAPVGVVGTSPASVVGSATYRTVVSSTSSTPIGASGTSPRVPGATLGVSQMPLGVSEMSLVASSATRPETVLPSTAGCNPVSVDGALGQAVWTQAAVISTSISPAPTKPDQQGPQDYCLPVDSDAIKVEVDSPVAAADGADVDGSGPSTSSKTYTCKTCCRDFATEKYLNMHMSLHLQSAAAVAYPGPPNVSPAIAVSSSVDSGTGCAPESQPVTMTSMVLTSQQQLMMAPPPIRRTKAISLGAGGGTTSQWTCQICEKTFAQNSNYKNHIRTHSNERPFVCEICSIGFKERYHLKKHVLFKHTDELREECRVCGKRFKDSTAVRAHERTHSDARPYACPRCDKTFKTSECLWHHENRSKTCGKSLGDMLTAAQRPARPRRGRQPRRPGRSPTQPPAPPAAVTPQLPLAIFPSQDSKVDVSAIVARELRCHPPSQAHHNHHHHQQQQHPHHSVYLSCISPSSAQFSELAPTGAHHTASPDQPESGFVSFDVAGVDWTHESSSHPDSARSDPSHPVVKVESSEMIELLDYNLAAFNTDSLSSYTDVFDKMKVDMDPGEVCDEYDDDMDDDDDEDGCQTQQQLLGHSINGHTVYHQSEDIERAAAFGRCPQTPSGDGHYDELDQRPYRCDLCRVGFKLKVHLKKHNLYKHSDDYPCQCKVCGKPFKDSSAVRLHERIHSSARPFQCECGKSFKTRENLWGHRHRGPCDLSGGPALLDCGSYQSSALAGHRVDMATALTQQKRQCLDMEAPSGGHVFFSTHEAGEWTPLPLDEVRAASMPPYRGGRGPSAPSASAAFLGGLVPTAVVAPIKRELPEPSPAGGGVATTSGGGAEKYSLPPFETLVTSHRSPETAAASPAATTAATDKLLPSGSTIAGPSDHHLPGIHQLFQTATVTPGQSLTGSGNSMAAAVGGANEAVWSYQQVPGVSALQLPLQSQIFDFLSKSDSDSICDDGLPPPPPYPGFPQPGKLPLAGSYLAYGAAGNGSSATEYNFQSILSSARR